ncbi:MAG: hypothetical protein AB1664_10165 [Thermodesulfobacteriota bacterium]
MPLAQHEIQVGAVAYFDVTVLNGDARITQPYSPTTRPSPFACFEVGHDRSAWAAITTKQRPDGKRLEVEKAWRLGGSTQWNNDSLFLNDGACTYVGPDQAFIDAAVTEQAFVTIPRPGISATGVAQIITAVQKRHGNRL